MDLLSQENTVQKSGEGDKNAQLFYGLKVAFHFKESPIADKSDARISSVLINFSLQPTPWSTNICEQPNLRR